MSAYTPGFVMPLPQDSNSLVGVVQISPDTIYLQEVMLAADEVVLLQSGDIITSIKDVIPLSATVALGAAALNAEGVIEFTPLTPAGTDPYWSYVTAMSDSDYQAGTTQETIVDGCAVLHRWPVLDAKKSSRLWAGYAYRTVAVAELLLFGRNTVKTYSYSAGTFVEAASSYIIPGSGVCSTPQSSGITGDFTFEQWISMDAICQNINISIPGVAHLYTGHGGVQEGYEECTLRTGNSSIGPIYTSFAIPILPPILTYFHFCVERVGRVITMYINGVVIAQATQDVIYAVIGSIRTSVVYSGPYRLTQGVVRYNGPFTPPTDVFPIGYVP